MAHGLFINFDMKRIILSAICVCTCWISNAQYSEVSLGDIIDIGGIKAIVFQVDETASHGKAMAIQALRGKENLWCNDKKLIDGIPPLTDKEDGLANTKQIFNYADTTNTINHFPVFQWCKKLGDGWYVPALKEIEAFVNYWVGNEQTLDWDAEFSEETEYALDENKPYYKTVNKKLVEAGGIPFINGALSSTVDNDGKVYVFWFNREKNSWSFPRRAKNHLSKYYVGRAIHKF